MASKRTKSEIVKAMDQLKASKKRGAGGGGGRNVKVMPVADMSDVKHAQEEFAGTVGRNLSDVKKFLDHEFGMDGDALEFLDEKTGDWRPLTEGEVQHFGGGVMKVRDPRLFDPDFDDEGDMNMTDFMGSRNPYDAMNMPMGPATGGVGFAVVKLAAMCKEDGYERVAGGDDLDGSVGGAALRLRHAGTGEDTSTREWVLKKAGEDKDLLSLVVEHVGALDHIVQCLHIDAVWEGRLGEE